MKNAFINSQSVLTAWGYVEANEGDTALEVADDFELVPGAWRWDGSSWQPYAPVIVPSEVSMMQARLALLQTGLLDQVDAQIAAMTDPPRIASKIRWEFATAVRRDDPLVAELGAALGLSQAQLDALFIQAATL